uniref:Fibronectin type-III domain-containing protein n=1 Tax=Chelydra serpentina TaxID=8475 RepID=A0A8C3SVA8_CHESE
MLSAGVNWLTRTAHRLTTPYTMFSQLNVFLRTHQHLQTQPNVECILFNDEYLTCTWGSKETLTANYSLYYWYIPPRCPAPTEECKRYLQEGGINTGCWFNHNEIIQFRPFYIHVNASHGGRSLVIPTKVMKLQDLVKPTPPVNLTIQNLSNNQLQLTWDSIYAKPHCLEYAVKYRSNQDTSWTEHLVSGKIFSFPSVDYEKYYTFYVKSKINQYCGTTQLWSEWSVPVFWGNNATDKGRGVLGPTRGKTLIIIMICSSGRTECRTDGQMARRLAGKQGGGKGYGVRRREDGEVRGRGGGRMVGGGGCQTDGAAPRPPLAPNPLLQPRAHTQHPNSLPEAAPLPHPNSLPEP